MIEGNRPPLPERNPITHAAHRSQVFWQILFPLIVGGLIILALAIGAGFMSYGAASQAANISTMWLLLPVLFFALLFIILLAGITYGLIRLIGIIPPYAAAVQNFFTAVNLKVRQISDQAAEPVMKASSAQASLDAFFKRKSPGRH